MVVRLPSHQRASPWPSPGRSHLQQEPPSSTPPLVNGFGGLDECQVRDFFGSATRSQLSRGAIPSKQSSIQCTTSSASCPGTSCPRNDLDAARRASRPLSFRSVRRVTPSLHPGGYLHRPALVGSFPDERTSSVRLRGAARSRTKPSSGPTRPRACADPVRASLGPAAARSEPGARCGRRERTRTVS